MPWLSLDNATTLLDHDLNKARKALERGISKSWLMRQNGVPQPATDPNVPLRIRVMPSPGWRLEGESLARESCAVLGRIPNRMFRQAVGTLYSEFVVKD